MAPMGKMFEKAKSLTKKLKEMVIPSQGGEPGSATSKAEASPKQPASDSTSTTVAETRPETSSGAPVAAAPTPPLVAAATPLPESLASSAPEPAQPVREGKTDTPSVAPTTSSSMATPVVLTIGSSGNVGKAAISSLAIKPVTVKVGVRDPSKPFSDNLGKNCSLVAADFSKPETLKTAMQGVDNVFIITPGASDKIELVSNAIVAAKEENVKHIVLISVVTAESGYGIFAGQFIPIEKQLKESGIGYTILRLPLFTDNQWGNKGSITSEGAIYSPGKPEAKYVTIATADVGDAAAEILANPSKHKGKIYKLTTEAYSSEDLAKAWSEALGKEVKYVQVPYEAAKEGMSGGGFQDWQVDGILELLKGIDAEDPVLITPSKDVEDILGRPPLSIQGWTKVVAPVFV